MTGLEVVVGCLAAWAWNKARRVAGRADETVDEALDSAMERIHTAVLNKLGPDPAVRQLESEVGDDLDSCVLREGTGQRLRSALDRAVETDSQFAAELQDVLAGIPFEHREAFARKVTGATPPGSGSGRAASTSAERSIAIGGDNSGVVVTGDGSIIVQRG